MTKKPKRGTLSTRAYADKKEKKAPKHPDVTGRMKDLLGKNKVRFHPHANQRMAERNVIDYEVRQALHNGKHDPQRDRFSQEHDSWEYSFEGQTMDNRLLRIGISFEEDKKTGEEF